MMSLLKKIRFCLVASLALLALSCTNPFLLDAAKLYVVSFETNCDTKLDSYRTAKVKEIRTLEKPDADFAGWYTSASFAGGAVEFPYELTEDTTLYAKWNQKYLVAFETNGGSDVAAYKASVIKDEPVTAKADSVFAGWFTEQNFAGERAEFPYTVSGQTVFYAKWNNFYTVRFETNGGTALTSLKTAVIEDFPLSSRTGYVLTGWFLDEDFSTPVSFPFALTEDITLYAEWKVLPSYTATFVANGGTAVQSVQTAIIDKAPVTEKNSYFFAGWFLDCDCTEPAVFPYTLTKDTTFYAKWTAKPTYMATFVTNGGSYVQSVYASTIFDVPITEKSAYNFSGWFLDSEFSKSVVFPYTLTSDTTFYAKWAEKQKVKYTVEHYQQDENLSSYTRVDIETLYDIEDCLTKAAAKTYAGFHAEEFSQVKIRPDGSSTVKICYDRNAYFICFDANGGNGTMKEQTFYYGVRQELQKNIFAFTNHFFSGWSTAKTGGKQYADGDSILNLSAGNGDVITLYAQWDYGSVVTELTVATLDLSNLQTEDFLVRVEGAVSPYMLEFLAGKIKQSSAYIELDLLNTTGITEINATGPSYDPVSIFKGCVKLKKLILPKTLKTIGDYAFCGCDFVSIVVPESVESIGEYAFMSCKNLETFSIPKNVTVIRDRTFRDCTSVKFVSIPDSVLSIENAAFSGCESLRNIDLGNGVKTIGEYAFAATVLESITIPKSVIEIGAYIFSAVDTLSYVKFLDDVSTWTVSYSYYNYYNECTISVNSPLTNVKYMQETYRGYTWTKN